MSRTIEGIVESFEAATALRKAGKPVWRHTIRLGAVFHNDDLTFEQKRDAIVETIKASQWYRDADPDDAEGLVELVDNLATDDADSFDYWWDLIYDIADSDRVWIDTHGSAS